MINSLRYIALLTAVVCLFVNLAPSLLGATEESSSAAIDTLPTYVVVATRTPLMLDRVSPSVSYISADVIEFWQDHRLVDALERETGVALRNNGALGSQLHFSCVIRRVTTLVFS